MWYFHKKKRARSALLCAKMTVRKLKGITVDVEILSKRKEEAQNEGLECEMIEEALASVKLAKEEWERVKQKGAELREKKNS